MQQIDWMKNLVDKKGTNERESKNDLSKTYKEQRRIIR